MNERVGFHKNYTILIILIIYLLVEIKKTIHAMRVVIYTTLGCKAYKDKL